MSEEQAEPPNAAEPSSHVPDETSVASPNDSTAPAQENPITPAILKSAYNAFKKRWKLTSLDHDSRIGRGPLSGRSSSIAGIVPPDQFPRAVWQELVKQGRLKYEGDGFYRMP